MDKPAIILTSPEELLQARLNQPRVSVEYLRKQRERHRLASEAFAKAARNATAAWTNWPCSMLTLPRVEGRARGDSAD